MRSDERFSKYFNLGNSSYYFDFFDIKINRDTKAFLDPGILRATDNIFANECKKSIQNFFQCFLETLKLNDEERALKLLAGLRETNYYHLGLSRGKSNGNSTGPELNKKIWDSFKNSRAAQSELLQDIEDSALFIDQIGPDRISDMVCAILREKFANYTLEICSHYKLTANLKLTSLECWEHNQWKKKDFLLPETEYTPIILIPKFLIRRKTITSSRHFQNNYILPKLREIEINANSELVKIIKSKNEPTVNKKDLRKKYGTDKKSIVEQTIKYKGALEKYRNEISSLPPKFLPLDEISRIMGVSFFRPNDILDEIATIRPSKEYNETYNHFIDLIVNSIFHGSIIFKDSQIKDHSSKTRYYTNNSNEFFNHIKNQLNSRYINFFRINGDLNNINDLNLNESNTFNIIFCRRNLLKTKINKNTIVISDNDFKEFIYDYQEGFLFLSSGFLFNKLTN